MHCSNSCSWHNKNIINKQQSQQDNRPSMQDDVQSLTIPLLTEFLVFFKATLSTKLALIQSLYAPSSQSSTNLLTKFSSKTIAYSPAQCPFQVKIGDANIRAIHRFYLRVREYLEWRLCGAIVVGEVDLFQNSMQKLFMNIKAGPIASNTHQYHQIHVSNLSSQTVGDLFLQIIELEEKFIYKLLDKIRKTHPNGIESTTVDQIVIFMRDKMDAEGGVRRYWRAKKEQQIENQKHSGMFVGGNSYTKLRPWMHRKDIIMINKDISIDSHQNNHFNSVYRTGSPFSHASVSYLYTSPLGNRSNHYLVSDQDKYHEECPQNEGIQLLARYARKEKQKIVSNAKKMMADVMEIDYDNDHNALTIDRNQRQESSFMDDLLLKNEKNRQMIDRFIRKYHRKMRKNSEHEHNARQQPKSSNKSMKSAKCEQSASMLAGDSAMKAKNNRSMFKSKGSIAGQPKDLAIQVLGVKGGKKVLHLQLPTINGASRRKTTIDK